METISKPLFHFANLLEKLDISFAIIGGVAVSLLAQNRFTDDVDFTITIDERQAKRLESHFKGDPAYTIKQLNFISSSTIPDMFRIIWEETPVDLLVANTDFQKELVRRAQSRIIEGKKIPIASPEDLVVLKLIADRPIDRADIGDILNRFQKIDWAYIEKWCKVWEIEDRLKALQGGDLP